MKGWQDGLALGRLGLGLYANSIRVNPNTTRLAKQVKTFKLENDPRVTRHMPDFSRFKKSHKQVDPFLDPNATYLTYLT
jgi:hypothetical protein